MRCLISVVIFLYITRLVLSQSFCWKYSYTGSCSSAGLALGYHYDGATCWAPCPPFVSYNCGAMCATGSSTCAEAVFVITSEVCDTPIGCSSNCDDNNPCTTDSCTPTWNPGTSGICSHTPISGCIPYTNIILYVGCYADNSNRVLPMQVTGNTFVPQTCGMACAAGGYRFAGVQDGGQCFCGNTIPPQNATNCNMQCTSNNVLLCGGSWANSVYQIAYQGCYTDNPSRTLPNQAPGSSWTVETCIGECTGLQVGSRVGWYYAGLQDGGQCFCGQDPPTQSSTSCNMLCSSGSENCGGSWANSVYLTQPTYNFMVLNLPNFQGCFADYQSRTLPTQLSGSNFVPDTCIAACTSQGYYYAGIQDGGQCFCGNTYPSTWSTGCNMPCTADSSQICGGVWANSVYMVNDPFVWKEGNPPQFTHDGAQTKHQVQQQHQSAHTKQKVHQQKSKHSVHTNQKAHQ